MKNLKEHLTVLSEAEYAAFYEVPDFDNSQQYEFLTLTQQELEIAMNRKGLSNQIFCCLQIGYFKAVNLFFGRSWQIVSKEDCNFVIKQYFNDCTFIAKEITIYEYYTQCNLIMGICGYTAWSNGYEVKLLDKSSELITQSINPQYIALELLSYLRTNKIVRPQCKLPIKTQLN